MPILRNYRNVALSISASVIIGSPVLAQQEVRQWVQQHAIPIYAISPDSTDYADLVPLGNAIGEARIVMLGEQDHGDASTFTAKTRLIQYLHEKKGFNVLAFESEFFGLTDGWDKTRGQPAAIDSLIARYLTYVWAGCDACQPLLTQYIPATQRTSYPLRLAGIDCDLAPKYVIPALENLLSALQVPLATSTNYSSETLPLIRNWGRNLHDTVLNYRYLQLMSSIKTQLKDKLPAGNIWPQVIDNLVAMDSVWKYNNYSTFWIMSNARDAQMAANLNWLVTQRYAGEKIIVWAHNYHVSKYSGHYGVGYLNNGITMGTAFTNSPTINDQTYILGFSSYEGTTGWVNRPPYPLPKKVSDGFESWIPANLDYAFLDFKAFNRIAPGFDKNFNLAAGGINRTWYHKDMEAPWNKIFDGVFFIRNMEACKAIRTTSKRQTAPGTN